MTTLDLLKWDIERKHYRGYFYTVFTNDNLKYLLFDNGKIFIRKDDITILEKI